MRIKPACENGNVFNPRETNESFNISWSANEPRAPGTRTNNSQLNSNCFYSSVESTETLNYTSIDTLDSNVNGFTVCNRQFRINAQKNSCNNSLTLNNLENIRDLCNQQCIKGESDVYSDETPIEDERVFEHSDTEEMSERGVHLVPRGIVNPNYPGFQHLAHTLQDYSSNIENFYQSENEMTDDDADVEITDLAFEPEDNQTTTSIESQNNNNNDETKETTLHEDLYPKTLDSTNQNEMPDLIQNLSKQNNNHDVDLFSYELNCSDADLENNFNVKDIIGDFNKEVEDEIKQLLNYNINIQDDLEELRKDIKDTLAKPIENTINNISDVVNHVIKKLVESDFIEDTGDAVNIPEPSAKEDDIAVNKENEKNARTEMHLSRPTFLNIDTSNSKIDDAVLSDGKDEIDVSKYDADKLSQNVENTIKQLSTELRKIIPKLDEMRQRDKLWAECTSQSQIAPVVTDGNSNEIKNSSTIYDFVSAKTDTKRTSNCKNEPHIAYATIRNIPVKSQTESRPSKDLQKDGASSKKCYHSAHSNTSVLSDDSKDLDIGCFDVYNIETALPKLDIDAIENHLRAAKEAERRKRNDREEIRKRLAMGAEAEEYYSLGYTDRPGKKPSLHSRLQNGMNLQICFMNETASDNESQSELDRNISNSKSSSRTSLFSKNSYNYNHPYQTRPLSVTITKNDKISTPQSGAKLCPTSLTLKTKSRSSHSLNHIEVKESDFFALQATLQTEARVALAQAKEMARIQMERERRGRAVSPVTEMLRRSMQKASAPLAADRRRVSRQLLTDMNIAQLQVIVNELHSQIEGLNEALVTLLMARDELHMGQDSMLVDIEDLTRYLGVKEQSKKTKGTAKAGMKRLTSLVHK